MPRPRLTLLVSLLLVLGGVAVWRASARDPTPAAAPPPAAPAASGEPALVVTPVEVAPVIDGDGSDAAWALAPALVVTVAPDIGGFSEDQKFPVELRACSTKEGTFLRARWHVVAAFAEQNNDPQSMLYVPDALYVSWRPDDELYRGFPTPEERVWIAGQDAAPGPTTARGIREDGRWTVEVRSPRARGAAGYLVVDVHGAHGASIATTKVR